MSITPTAHIIKGIWRTSDVSGMTFPLISPGIMDSTKGGYYITVYGGATFPNTKNIRVYFDKKSDVKLTGVNLEEDDNTNKATNSNFSSVEDLTVDVPLEGDFNGETEVGAIERITKRFEILEEMTEAVGDGVVRGMIVSGAPGIGKSYGVEKVLKKHSMMQMDGAKSEIVRGVLTPVGMYRKLFEFSNDFNVLVFDDSDSVFFDQMTLGLLKVALDTSNERVIQWNAQNHELAKDGIPSQFEFKGGIIFITNMDIENTRSKILQPHLDALISRTHYLDLTIHTRRDKFLRIKSLVEDGNIMKKYNFHNENMESEILDYVRNNVTKLRELSLRTVLKIADLAKMRPSHWRDLADVTLLRGK